MARAGGTLAERWNGKKWTIQPTPNPTGSDGAFLHGVSCTAANACIAVGHYDQSGGGGATVAERWDGKNWTLQPTPTKGAIAGLDGVSCTAAHACTAVGGYGTTITGKTLAQYWNGNKWAIQSTPSPTISAGLGGVFCTASDTCTAVGSYTKTFGGAGTAFAERNT